jgi:hypothetical protein
MDYDKIYQALCDTLTIEAYRARTAQDMYELRLASHRMIGAQEFAERLGLPSARVADVLHAFNQVFIEAQQNME